MDDMDVSFEGQKQTWRDYFRTCRVLLMALSGHPRDVRLVSLLLAAVTSSPTDKAKMVQQPFTSPEATIRRGAACSRAYERAVRCWNSERPATANPPGKFYHGP